MGRRQTRRCHQIEVLDLLTDLNHTRGTTIVMVLHDLNLAARHSDHLIALADGRIHAARDPHSVLTEDCVRTEHDHIVPTSVF